MAVTPANAADREVIDELLGNPATDTTSAAPDTDADADVTITDHGEQVHNESEPNVSEGYGDSAYADGATLDEQTQRGHDMRAKVPPVRNANGYSKDQFRIDLAASTVTCPAGHTVAISTGRRQQIAHFGALCESCPLRADRLHQSPPWTGDHHPYP